MVESFKEYDANDSGTIDIHEMRKILLHMEMDVGMDKAQELMDKIDVDKSGEIDFDEYCRCVNLLFSTISFSLSQTTVLSAIM